MKKHPTETIHFVGSPEVFEANGAFAATEIAPELDTNPTGMYLRGIRLREELSQEELAKLTRISRSNISAMEHGRRRQVS